MNRLLMMFIMLLICAGLSAIAARAEPYWVSYDGTDFPENQGWTRHTGGGGANRWLEDGALVLESEPGHLIYDYYSMHRAISPGSGELFLMRWRLQANRIGTYGDPTVAAFSDDGWGAGFEYWPTHVESAYEDDLSVPLSLGEYHEFAFRSWDMRSYDFFVDGVQAWSGEFRFVLTDPRVSWGDGTEGQSSLTYWDYFAFGVVPEPSGGLMTLCLGLLLLHKRYQCITNKEIEHARDSFYRHKRSCGNGARFSR